MPKIAILAGGLATRMHPLTLDCPKALLPVAGEPFAFHQLRLLKTKGFEEAVFLIGHLGEQIVSAVGDGSRFGMRIEFVSDGPKLCGTGMAIKRALPILGKEFAVIYGDSWLDFEYSAAVDCFRNTLKPALMTVITAQLGSEQPNAEYAAGNIIRYSKSNPSSKMKHIDYGFSVFRDAVFASLPPDNHADLAEIQQSLSEEGDLAGYEATKPYFEIGSISGRDNLESHLRGFDNDAPA